MTPQNDILVCSLKQARAQTDDVLVTILDQKTMQEKQSVVVQTLPGQNQVIALPDGFLAHISEQASLDIQRYAPLEETPPKDTQPNFKLI